MGKGKSKAKKSGKKSSGKSVDQKAAVAKLPKKKCCESKSRCGRCPLRMLKEGTLPDGYTVHRRKLVKTSELAPKSAARKKQSAA